jgi:hypothetical protein
VHLNESCISLYYSERRQNCTHRTKTLGELHYDILQIERHETKKFKLCAINEFRKVTARNKLQTFIMHGYHGLTKGNETQEQGVHYQMIH